MSNRSTSSSKLFLGTVSQCFKVYILQTILSKHHHAISCFFFVQGGSRPKRTIFRVFWVLGCYGVFWGVTNIFKKHHSKFGRHWPSMAARPFCSHEGFNSYGPRRHPLTKVPINLSSIIIVTFFQPHCLIADY